jgi:2-polyprenyl-3-methyl-5-hydroxy-6-metoxy-1,4-benzoquinol methylase
MDAQADLGSQQKHLVSIDYDLRITNLARFIHKKIREVHGSKKIKLIDIGAGNGLFLKFFKNEGINVTGRIRTDTG